MDLNYSQEELAFRDQVRGWLKDNLPKDLAAKIANYEELGREDLLRWHKILAKQGWVAPAWPKEWGGTGWSVVQRYIFEEECGFAGTPPIVSFSIHMCGPVLLRFGTDEQKQRFLPRMYNGEDFWCQGYSEPGSGSDLASLKTKAVRDGDHYVVNGQKIWTTLGHYADWIFVLCRTDPKAKKPQEGISFILVDMKTPGVEVRPIITMDGGHEVNETWFTDVKVPVANLVGKENEGWTYAKYLLAHERTGIAGVARSKKGIERLKKIASVELDRGEPIIRNPEFARKLSEVEIDLTALEYTELRTLASESKGRGPGPESSILKIKGTE
ncbi:MAG TPA: acyl-CoA dehydrogenase family protein, partial [Burkholderiales bacterium]|nr:acyl-CoA dehydrogenase family protein [Burkholderiales bacterium]